MSSLCINLFGKLKIQYGDQTLIELEARRAQELFCYFLLYRERLHEREKLSSMMWGDNSSERAKKYLRQTLWQIQSVFNIPCIPEKILLVENSWIGINPHTNFWLDVAIFDQAFACVEKTQGATLVPQQVQLLREAVQVYQGDLLEGCYLDWCIYERDRYQNMYLSMLDKLLSYCEAQHDYETGLLYGTQILRYDRARESTHRRLMRLHHLAGNRTAALHQYEACVAALMEELNVPPAKSTLRLYQQIRTDQIMSPAYATTELRERTAPVVTLQPMALQQLEQIQSALTQLQDQIAQWMQNIEQSQLEPAVGQRSAAK